MREGTIRPAGRDRRLAGECPFTPPVDDLDASRCLTPHKTVPAGTGKAWIAATVTAKSGWGQEIKPNILGVNNLDHVRLSVQCNPCRVYEWERRKGGNRESEQRLAQSGTEGNRVRNLCQDSLEMSPSLTPWRRSREGSTGLSHRPIPRLWGYCPSFSKNRQIDSIPR